MTTSPKVAALLKACANNKDLRNAAQLHSEILQRGWLDTSPHLATSLMSMYIRCGLLAKARQVLDDLPIRDVVSWSALIAGYAQHGHVSDAVKCFQRMKAEGFSPNAVTFTCLLKACGSAGAITKGQEFHREIAIQGSIDNNLILGNALIDMYVKCNALDKAVQVLKELPVRDVISWSALITGYAHHGQGQEAMSCFRQMHSEGLSPNAVTFVGVLKACGNTGDIFVGKQIHEEIINRGLLARDVKVGNALVDMYVKCGALGEARHVLEMLPNRDVVSWSTLIAGFAQNCQYQKALDCFQDMQDEGLSPNEVTFICMLKACGNQGAIEMGKQIHEEIANRGLLETDVVLGTALMDMYVKCGELPKAREVLAELPIRDTVSWSALIAGYAQQGEYHEAVNCFEKMKSEGLSPNVVTFACLLKACSSTGATDTGQEIHDEIVRRDLLQKEVILGTALVDMYAKSGMLTKARSVLKKMPLRDEISWNALLFGYVQQGQCDEAFNCLQQMKSEGLSPNGITFTCMLKACGTAGAIDTGHRVHREIVNSNLLATNIRVGNALLDMYMKCHAPFKAHEVHDALSVRSVVSWNALIAGYAKEGHVHNALNCFEQMQCEGLSPDEITFLSLLNVCGHSGLLSEAQLLLENMIGKHHVSVNLDHHTCMVVMLGFAGHFDKAISVIRSMPSSDHLDVWLALLGACKKWGFLKLAMLAFHEAVQLDDGHSAIFVLTANIFAAAGMQTDARQIEAHVKCKDNKVMPM